MKIITVKKSSGEKLGRYIILQKSDVVIHSGAEYYIKKEWVC
jgi:hypothetical protein